MDVSYVARRTRCLALSVLIFSPFPSLLQLDVDADMHNAWRWQRSDDMTQPLIFFDLPAVPHSLGVASVL